MPSSDYKYCILFNPPPPEQKQKDENDSPAKENTNRKRNLNDSDTKPNKRHHVDPNRNVQFFLNIKGLGFMIVSVCLFFITVL